MINNIMKYVFTIILVLPLLIALLRTILMEKPPPPPRCNASDSDFISLKNRGLAERFAKALSFATVTNQAHSYDQEQLKQFGLFIESAFPHIHKSPLVNRKVVNGLSLLYHIKGSDTTLKPYLIASHLDVVPAEPDRWTQPPFGGKIHNGFIYGRGSIDAKHITMGCMEALEFLLENKFIPQRPFFIAFGHDEEAFGLDGAQSIANYLQSEKVELEYVIDEGMMVINDSIPGINRPIAMIGVAEKGQIMLELSVEGVPGHSSIPPEKTSIVTLAKAISKLETSSHPNMFGLGPEKGMFEEAAPYASFFYKFVYGNLWLFGKLVSCALELNPTGNGFSRTTTAVTIIYGGVKANVIPSSATAIVNHRIHPAQTIEEVVEYDAYLINDPDVKIRILDAIPPHPISPHSDTTFGYQTIKKTLLQIYSDSVVVPTTMIANTDTRWYLPLTNAVYRCSPVNLLPEDTKLFHGDDERISLRNYEQVVNFYLHLIENSDKSHLDQSSTEHIEL